MKFKVYKIRGTWYLHCERCDSTEWASSFLEAHRLIPTHLRWWHTGPITILNHYREVGRA